MGNIIPSIISSLTHFAGKIFGPPLEFLSGKSCSSVCGSTWDLTCYIENFCVSNLLKLLAVSVLLYIVLLFVYLLYKIGICECVCNGICKMTWGCFSSCYRAVEYGWMLTWLTLDRRRRRRRRRVEDIEGVVVEEEEEEEEEGYDNIRSSTEEDEVILRPRTRTTYLRSRSLELRDQRRLRMQRSLRPRRTHRISDGIGRDYAGLGYETHRRRRSGGRVETADGIRVTRTSRFVQRGRFGNGGFCNGRGW